MRSRRTTAIPQAFLNQIKRAGADYSKDVQAYLRTKDKVHRDAQDLAKFRESDTSYPAGIRPYLTSDTFTELDAPLDQAKEADIVLGTVTIPMGTTRRKAISLIHHDAMKGIKAIEGQAHRERMANLEGRSRKVVFVQTCQELVKKAREQDSQSWGTLGLDAPLAHSISDEVLNNKIEQTYKEIMTKAMEQQNAKRASKAKQDEDLKKKTEKLLKADPQVAFKEAVLQAIGPQANDDQDMENAEEPKPDFINEFINLTKGKSKNGQAPLQSKERTSGKGKKSRATGGEGGNTGKGKGNVSAKKGKDKGKGKSHKAKNDISQAKGKGKGKGKNKNDKFKKGKSKGKSKAKGRGRD
jgi:hypothetical protein